LNGLPLALSQAGSFIGLSNIGVKEYIQYFDETWSDLMKKQDQFPLQDYGQRSMLTTWKISYDQVLRRSETAAWLLRLWAFFHHDDFWFGLLDNSGDIAHNLREGEEFELPTWLAELSGSELEFSSAMGLLNAYSLAESTGGGSYTMHPVLHRHIRSLLSDHEESSLLLISVCVLGIIASSENDVGHWKLDRRLLQHVLHVSAQLHAPHTLAEQQVPASVTSKLGNLLQRQGKLLEAEQMYQRTLASHEESLGTDHASTLDTVASLGSLYLSQGKLYEAKQMHQRAQAGYNKVHGPNYTWTSDAVKKFGILGRILGSLDEKERTDQRNNFLTTKNDAAAKLDSTDASSVTKGFSDSTFSAPGSIHTITSATSVTASVPMKPLSVLTEDVASPPSVASSTSTLDLTDDGKEIYAMELTQQLLNALQDKLGVGVDTSRLEQRFTKDLGTFSAMLSNKSKTGDRRVRKVSRFVSRTKG
jgi:tetratricopeptide (TPR) repeat protein